MCRCTCNAGKKPFVLHDNILCKLTNQYYIDARQNAIEIYRLRVDRINEEFTTRDLYIDNSNETNV